MIVHADDPNPMGRFGRSTDALAMRDRMLRSRSLVELRCIRLGT